uniref:Uncharacterized protein n=1 Tax=Oryza rufipogon TaxID=4529 RepID=A0A0E0R146_ORYRU
MFFTVLWYRVISHKTSIKSPRYWLFHLQMGETLCNGVIYFIILSFLLFFLFLFLLLLLLFLLLFFLLLFLFFLLLFFCRSNRHNVNLPNLL